MRKPIAAAAAGKPGSVSQSTGTATGYGQTFTAHGPDGLAIRAGIQLPGRHNVANALLALAALVGRAASNPAETDVPDCSPANGAARLARVSKTGNAANAPIRPPTAANSVARAAKRAAM